MTFRTLEPTNDRLQIAVLDEPLKGGPEHQHSCLYRVTNMDASTNPAWMGADQHAVTLLMQCGPVPGGRPANGLTEAALLAIVVDRLRSLGSPVTGQCEAALAALKEYRV